MASSRFHLPLFLAALCVAIHCFQQQKAEAQVTFSRDWEAGKRAVATECIGTFKSAAAVCQMFLNEVRTMMNCEVQHLLTMMKQRVPDEDIDSF